MTTKTRGRTEGRASTTRTTGWWKTQQEHTLSSCSHGAHPLLGDHDCRCCFPLKETDTRSTNEALLRFTLFKRHLTYSFLMVWSENTGGCDVGAHATENTGGGTLFDDHWVISQVKVGLFS